MAGLVAIVFLSAACSSSSTHLAVDASPGSDAHRLPSGVEAGLGDAGLGDAGVDANGGHSGSRLKLARLETADGTHIPYGAYDSLLAQPCSFTTWNDGHAYCVPYSASPAYVFDGYFADAGCTQPVVASYREPGCTVAAPPAYALQSTITCEASVGAHLYQVGARLTTTTYVRDATTGTCISQSLGAYDTYRLGPEIAVSTLAPMTFGSPTGADLSERHYTSTDGYVSAESVIHDGRDAVDCYATPLADGTALCLPTAGVAYSIGYFHDAQCTQPEALVASGCPAPSYIYAYDHIECPGSSFHLDAVGAEVSDTTFYSSNSTCVQLSPQAGSDAYLTGAPVALPQFTSTIDDGTQRVRTRHLHDGAFTTLVSGAYDTQLGTPCAFGAAADGQTRCLPSASSSSVTMYTSASCATGSELAVVPVLHGGTSCNAPPAPSFATRGESTSGTCGTAVYPVGAPYAGSLYSSVGTACVPASSSSLTYYTVGAALDPTALASATFRTDP